MEISKSDTAGKYNIGNHGSYFSANESQRLAKRFGFPEQRDIESDIGNAALFFELGIENNEQPTKDIRRGLKELLDALTAIDAALNQTTFAKMEALGAAEKAPSDQKINYWLSSLHEAVKQYGKPLEQLIPAALDAMEPGTPGRLATAEPRRNLIAALIDVYEERSGKTATITTHPFDGTHSGPALAFVVRCLARIRTVSVRSGSDKKTHCLSVSIATIAADIKKQIGRNRSKE